MQKKVVSFARFSLLFNCAKKTKGAQLTMASITQDLRFKQAVIEYSFKHGCRVVKHLLHIGEKRREELIGGLPAQGAHREVVVLVHVSP